MRFGSVRRSGTRAVVVALLTGIAVGAWLPAAISAPQQEVATAEEMWREGVALIHRGEFEAASNKIGQITPTGPVVSRIGEWLQGWQEQNERRAELGRQDFQTYVERAKKWRERGKITRALQNAQQALANAEDAEAFKQEAWLGQLAEDALAEGQRLCDEGEWQEGYRLYWQLCEIFDRDKTYRDLRQQCFQHARLDAIYHDDGKWEEQLEGVEWEMAKDALLRIDRYYVEPADFRAMTVAGLKQLLLLSESRSLADVFPQMKDKNLLYEYRSRLEERLRQAEKADRVKRGDGVDYFKLAMDINRQTLKLPDALIVSEFMVGALEPLDEFTSMIWPVEFREFDKHTRGDFVGVGIQISERYNNELDASEIVVVTPLEDTPAYRAGVQPDDIIVAVDGQSLQGVSVTRAVDIITGPPDTAVTLTIRRDSENKTFDVRLVRQTVKIQSVKGLQRNADDEQQWDYMLDPELGIGYIRVITFQDNTVADVERVISELKSQGMKGLIVDLRFDPGGLLRAAVDMASLFLDRGDLVVSTKGLKSQAMSAEVERDPPFADIPLIVLTNEASASASEIVSGALKDHGRATIVGMRTFGKFSVQNLMPLLGVSEAHLKLTTAHYTLPSGRSLHRDEDSVEWGVDPDIEVELVPKEIRKLHEMRRDRDILSNSKTPGDKPGDGVELDEFGEEIVGGDGFTRPMNIESIAGPGVDPSDLEDEPDPNNRPDVDPQLDAAVLLMRVDLMKDQYPAIAKRPSDDEAAEQ